MKTHNFIYESNNNHTLLRLPKVITHNWWADVSNQSVMYLCPKCKQNTKDEEIDVMFCAFFRSQFHFSVSCSPHYHTTEGEFIFEEYLPKICISCLKITHT